MRGALSDVTRRESSSSAGAHLARGAQPPQRFVLPALGPSRAPGAGLWRALGALCLRGERRPLPSHCHSSGSRARVSLVPREERRDGRREDARAVPRRAGQRQWQSELTAAQGGPCRGWCCAAPPRLAAAPRRALSRYPLGALEGLPRHRGCAGPPSLGALYQGTGCRAWAGADGGNLLTLQDFKVGNLLGKGSFAGVYRAVSLKTGLEVAIKMVRQPAEEVLVF